MILGLFAGGRMKDNGRILKGGGGHPQNVTTINI